MSITITETNLLPVRRDKQVGSSFTSGGGGSGATGSGSSPAANTYLPIDPIITTSLHYTGFPNRTDTTLAFVPGVSGATRTLTLAGTNFKIYIAGVQYTIATELTCQIPDVTGTYWFWITAPGGVPQLNGSTDAPGNGYGGARAGFDQCLVATVYWNTTTDAAILSDERHWMGRDKWYHEYLHQTVNARYHTGGALSFPTDSTFSITQCEIYDEELEHILTIATTCKCLYKNGDANWQWDTGNTTIKKIVAGAEKYNNGNTLTSVSTANHFVCWLFATNNTDEPFVSIIGQRQDVTLANARLNNTPDSLSFGSLPSAEMKLLYRVMFKQGTTAVIEVADYRNVTNLPVSNYTATDHSVLSKLGFSESGHTGFAPIDNPTFTGVVKADHIAENTVSHGTIFDNKIQVLGQVTINDKVQILSASYLNPSTPRNIFLADYFTTKGSSHFIGNWNSDDSYGIGPNTGNADNTIRIGRTDPSTSLWNNTQVTNLIIGGSLTASSVILTDITDGYIPYRNSGTDKLANSLFWTDGTNTGLGFTSPLSKFCINGGLHIGGESDAGDNNLLVDGTCEITGVSLFTGLVKTAGGVHVGGTSDPGADNLQVDGYVKTDEVNGTVSYIAGFTGSGYKLDKSGSDYSLTIDNLTVRKLMKIYELEINKISSVNGGIMVSIANGKVYSVTQNNIFDRWIKDPFSFSTFVSSGLNITNAVGVANDFALLYYSSSAYQYAIQSGIVITFTATHTKASGTAPLIRWFENGTEKQFDALAVGVNTFTYTTSAACNLTIQLGCPNGDATFTLTSVSITANDSKIYFDEDSSTAGTGNIIQFAVNDWIRAQEWTGRGVNYYLAKVQGVHHSETLGMASISVSNETGDPWVGADLVQVGNSSVAARQNLIYITAADSNNPYIDMVSGVTDGDFTGHIKLRIGNLAGLAGYDIVPVSPGYGLYAQNVFLSGKIVASSGSVGGWTIDSTSIKDAAGVVGLSSAVTGGDDIRIWAGNATAANAPFKVTESGALTATGVAEIGTATGNYGGSLNYNIAILGADIWENAYNGDNSVLYINTIGYNKGITKFRTTIIGDGKGNPMVEFIGSADNIKFTADAEFDGILNSDGAATFDGGVTFASLPTISTIYHRLAQYTTTERDNLSGVGGSDWEGTIIVNTTTHKLNFWNGSAWKEVTSS